MFIKQDKLRPITNVACVSSKMNELYVEYTDKETFVKEIFYHNLIPFQKSLVNLDDFKKFYKNGSKIEVRDGVMKIEYIANTYELPIIPYVELPKLDPIFNEDGISISKSLASAYKRHKGFIYEDLEVAYVKDGYIFTTDLDVVCATHSENLPEGFYEIRLLELLSEVGETTLYPSELQYTIFDGNSPLIRLKRDNLVKFFNIFPKVGMLNLLTKHFDCAIMIKATELKKKLRLFDCEEITISNSLDSDTIHEFLGGLGAPKIVVDFKSLKSVASRLSGDVTIHFGDNMIKLEDNKGFYVIGGNKE